MNVLGAEMEASLIFVLARIWGLRAGGASVVLDNALRVGGEEGEFDPEGQLDHGADHIERLALLGCETIRLPYEEDEGA